MNAHSKKTNARQERPQYNQQTHAADAPLKQSPAPVPLPAAACRTRRLPSGRVAPPLPAAPPPQSRLSQPPRATQPAPVRRRRRRRRCRPRRPH
eukprot:283847-Chlamydomonas_euryale.AAC.1